MTGRPPSSPLFPSTPLSRSPPPPDRSVPDTTAQVIGVGSARTSIRFVLDQTVPPGSTSVRSRSMVARRTIERLRTRSEEHTSELQSQSNLVCRLLLEKKKTK